jgi:hypothetical protein
MLLSCRNAAAVAYLLGACRFHPGKSFRDFFAAHCTPAGYIGSLSLLQTVVKVAEKLRQYNSQLTFGKGGRKVLRGLHGYTLLGV